MDSCTESAEAACDILSQLVNCTIKTLGLISTARPSFMDVSQVIELHCPVYQQHIIPTNLVMSLMTKLILHSHLVKMKCYSGSLSTPCPTPQAHFVSALTVVFVNSKSLSSIKIDDTPVDDPSLKVLVANNSDTLKLLKMSSCPHVSPAGHQKSFVILLLSAGTQRTRD